MRQRTKFAIALFIVALVVGSVVFFGLQWFQNQAESQAKEEIQQTANVVVNQTGKALENRAEDLRSFGSRTESGNRTLQGRELRAFANNANFRNVVIIDKNGTIVDIRGEVTDADREEIIGTKATSPYIERVNLTGGIRASGPSRSNGTYYLEIAAANFNDTQQVGVVAASLRADQITFPAETADKDTRTAELDVWNGSALISIKGKSDNFVEILDGSDSSDTFNQTASEATYGLPITVTVTQNPRRLSERLDNLTLIGSGSLLIVFFSVVALGYWEYSTNLKQTERLLEGFAKLREGDYEYTISLSSATEWQRISDGYNELTQGLAEREREIREREQQLEVLNRVLRHNLQNDMNVIIGHAEMLPRFSEDDRVEDAAETIVRMGEGLVSHGRKARHLETVMGGDDEVITADAVTVAETAVARYEDAYEATEFRLEGASRALVAVSDAFEYAVENLVENAAEHNDADEPVVEIKVASNKQTVDVQVTDNGPGIPEHEYEVLQEGAESALQHGSGVGLWLAHWIVERSDGWLSFADRSPTGSIVTVTVPRATDEDGEKGKAESGDGADTADVEEGD